MAARLFKGPNGVVFSPSENLHEDTVDQRVASGEWEPVEAPKPVKKAAAKPKSS